VHPEFIRLGPLDIHTYGVLVAIGFMVGLAVAAWRARREGVDPDRITDLGAWLVVSGMLGGKLFHIIYFSGTTSCTAWHQQGVRSLREGFVFYGGLIVATLTAAAYTTVKKLPFFRVADIFAPSLALGHAFGRLGCFFNGCCYGKVCAMRFSARCPVSQDLGCDRKTHREHAIYRSFAARFGEYFRDEILGGAPDGDFTKRSATWPFLPVSAPSTVAQTRRRSDLVAVRT
jgi:prolipoprotein diacylglyceryl transferase